VRRGVVQRWRVIAAGLLPAVGAVAAAAAGDRARIGRAGVRQHLVSLGADDCLALLHPIPASEKELL